MRGLDETARMRFYDDWALWGRRTVVPLSLLSAALVLSGCAQRWVMDYTVRKKEVVFAVQDGSSYQLAECKRHPDGRLTDCRLYEVELE